MYKRQVLLTRQMVRTRIQTAQPQSGVPIQLPRAEHRMTLLLCTAAVSTPCAEDLCIAHYEVVQVGRSAAAVLAAVSYTHLMSQINSIAGNLQAVFRVPPVATGIVLALLTGRRCV